MSYLPVNCDIVKAKHEFAEALLRHPKEPFTAARLVFPDNSQSALFIAQTWLNDDYVRSYQKTLLEEYGEEAFLPTAHELAHEVYYTAVKATTVKDKTDAFRLYADLRGFISKPQIVNNNNNGNTYTQNVLRVDNIDPTAVAERQRLLMIEAELDAD